MLKQNDSAWIPFGFNGTRLHVSLFVNTEWGPSDPALLSVIHTGQTAWAGTPVSTHDHTHSL